MKPENDNERAVREALKKAFPAMDTELHRDLWPSMLRRLAERPAAAIPWYDWVLAGCVAAALGLFPNLAWLFAYHL